MSYNDLNSLSFGQDEEGNWGYKPDGADTVIPFKKNTMIESGILGYVWGKTFDETKDLPAGTYRYCFSGYGNTTTYCPTFTIWVNDTTIVSNLKPDNYSNNYGVYGTRYGTFTLETDSVVRLRIYTTTNNSGMCTAAGGLIRISD